MSRIAHIASRPLEAAGAYYTAGTPTPLRGAWDNAKGETFITLAITYTKAVAAVNGRAKFRILWSSVDSTGTSVDFYETVIDPVLAIASTIATASVYFLVYDLIASTSGNPIRLFVNVKVPDDAAKIKVEPAEVGDVANPGTIVVEIDGKI